MHHLKTFPNVISSSVTITVGVENHLISYAMSPLAGFSVRLCNRFCWATVYNKWDLGYIPPCPRSPQAHLCSVVDYTLQQPWEALPQEGTCLLIHLHLLVLNFTDSIWIGASLWGRNPQSNTYDTIVCVSLCRHDCVSLWCVRVFSKVKYLSPKWVVDVRPNYWRQ